MNRSARALVLEAPDFLASGRYPLESPPRRGVGLDGAADLLATMSGERDGRRPWTEC